MTAPSRSCEHSGCQRRHYARGLCAMHYGRRARGTDMDAPVRDHDGTPRDLDHCSSPGCYRPRHCAGCAGHYQRKRRGGVVDKPLGSGRKPAGVPAVRAENRFWLSVWARHALDTEALATGLSVPEVLRAAVEFWASSRPQRQPEAEQTSEAA